MCIFRLEHMDAGLECDGDVDHDDDKANGDSMATQGIVAKATLRGDLLFQSCSSHHAKATSAVATVMALLLARVVGTARAFW